MRRIREVVLISTLAATIAGFAGVGAQEAEPPAEESGSDADLAKELANPVADLISVPLQLNYDCCTGPEDDGRTTLNFQPVIPFRLNDDWNLILRTILPVVHETSGGDRKGLGDTTQSFFFSPAAGGGPIWGVGPALLYPTGTDGFSAAKWGAGPTGLVLMQQGGTTYGVLANHIWSFAGVEDRPDISSTFIQPFFNHTFPSATSIVIQSESSYDWEREEWTVPVNAGVTQVFAPGEQRLQLGLFGRAYLDAPDDAPDWGVRFVTTFLFPEG
jgi:hypothetical protein